MLKHRFGVGGLGSVSAKKRYPKTMKRFMVFGYFLLTETDPNPPTNHKSMFQIPFHHYIDDVVLHEPIGTLTSWVNTYVPPI